MDISLLLSAAKSVPKTFPERGEELTTSPVSIQMGSADDVLHQQIEAASKHSMEQRLRGIERSPLLADSRDGANLRSLQLKGELLHSAIVKPGKELQTDTSTKSKLYMCPVPGCQAKFGQKGSLTRHLKSRHEKLRPHTCDLCEKSFSEKWTLNVHRRNVHEKRKPHKCTLCDKTFGERWNLRVCI